jgi:hypothetical protein
MSAADKTKLDGVATGAQVNAVTSGAVNTAIAASGYAWKTAWDNTCILEKYSITSTCTLNGYTGTFNAMYTVRTGGGARHTAMYNVNGIVVFNTVQIVSDGNGTYHVNHGSYYRTSGSGTPTFTWTESNKNFLCKNTSAAPNSSPDAGGGNLTPAWNTVWTGSAALATTGANNTITLSGATMQTGIKTRITLSPAITVYLDYCGYDETLNVGESWQGNPVYFEAYCGCTG